MSPRGEPTLVDSGPGLRRAGLVHRVLVPVSRPSAAVVMLHGRGGDEDKMWVFASTIPRDWLVVAPRAPERADIGGYAWRPREPDEWPTAGDFAAAVSVLGLFLSRLPDMYGADPSRTSLMGFSQGAAVAYALTLTDRSLSAAVAGLLGFVPDVTPEVVGRRPLAGLPVFAAAGESDELVPLERAQDGARVLAEAGAEVTFRTYPGGHRLPADGMRDLKAWWAERQRQDARSGAAPPTRGHQRRQ